jgi:hypothetical protein
MNCSAKEKESTLSVSTVFPVRLKDWLATGKRGAA